MLALARIAAHNFSSGHLKNMEVLRMSNARINLFWLIIFTCTLPIAVVFSTHLARKSFERVKIEEQTVYVKGYAELPITSDRAEWSTQIVERHADLAQAYAALERNRLTLLQYLSSHGFEQDAVTLGPVGISELRKRDAKGNYTNEIEFFVVRQRFSIASDDVQAIAQAARGAGDLISGGINLDSNSPSYLYTKLDEKKLEMLEQATSNARERAQLLVGNSGEKLGPLRSASQGVFQITPAFSNEVSGGGYNDTSSLNKVIKAVVTVEYAIREQ